VRLNEPMATIRQAQVGDEPTLRRLRLAAMTDCPTAFCSTYEREAARTEEDWRSWMTDPDATFLAETDDGDAVGIVASRPDPQEPTAVVHLLAMWVDPSVRGTGAVEALIDAVVARTEHHGAHTVRLHVEKRNQRARRVYERNGFVTTGLEIDGERPGWIEVEMERTVSPVTP
jgi:ribosomal protein S18 acetylase RimI-like enzyme